MKASSPVSTPCSTPVSPGQHVSPTPKPDRTYPHLAPPQPLPDSAYPIDHRYWYYQNTDRQTDRQTDRHHAWYLFYSVFVQISAAVVGAVSFVLLSFDVAGRTAHVSQTDVRTQHPLPSSGVQAGVRWPPLRTSGHGGGATPPDVPALHDDQTRASRLHLRLRWVLFTSLILTAIFCSICNISTKY